MTTQTVGTLLTGGEAPRGNGGAATAASTTMALWDDAVSEMMAATRELETTALTYKKECRGFVTGVGVLSELVGALESCPTAARPQAPSAEQLAALQRSSSEAAAAAGEARPRLRTPSLPSLEGAVAQQQGAQQQQHSQPDSGSRFIENIAKMGQEIFSGISTRSHRADRSGASPAPGVATTTAAEAAPTATATTASATAATAATTATTATTAVAAATAATVPPPTSDAGVAAGAGAAVATQVPSSAVSARQGACGDVRGGRAEGSDGNLTA